MCLDAASAEAEAPMTAEAEDRLIKSIKFV